MQKYHIWDLQHNYIGELDIYGISILTNDAIELDKIKFAVECEKGYGYYKCYYISKNYVKIYNLKELQSYYMEWVTHNYNTIKQTILKHKKTIDEDIYHDTILYVWDLIGKKEDIKSFLHHITYKYMNKMLDEWDKAEKKKVQYVNFSEFKYDVADICDVQTYDSINYIHLSTYIYNLITQNYLDYEIDIFNEHLLKKTQYIELSKKHNKKVSQVKYIYQKIVKFLRTKKNAIQEVYALIQYKTLEDYTLINIIQ